MAKEVVLARVEDGKVGVGDRDVDDRVGRLLAHVAAQVDQRVRFIAHRRGEALGTVADEDPEVRIARVAAKMLVRVEVGEVARLERADDEAGGEGHQSAVSVVPSHKVPLLT